MKELKGATAAIIVGILAVLYWTKAKAQPEPPPPSCEFDHDCPEGEVCVNNECVPEYIPPPECYADTDCPSGYICEGGLCVPDDTPPPPQPADLRVDDYYFAYAEGSDQNIPGDERPYPAISYAEINKAVSFWVKVHNFGGESGNLILKVLSVATQGMSFSVPAGESRWRQVQGRYDKPGNYEYAVYEGVSITPEHLLFTTWLSAIE